MPRKRDYQKWGKIISLIGGALFVIGGILLFFAHFLTGFTLDPLTSNFVVFFFNISLPSQSYFLILGIIGVALGAFAIIIANAERSDLLSGILLIVIGIVGLGIPGLFTFAGGILYLIASAKKR